MSSVYRAIDETLERPVAIKLMNREIATDSDQLERFKREARAVAQLSHPHLVGVIDYGEDQGRPYIVLEYVEGETLKERIRRKGELDVSEAVAYAIEIARALGDDGLTADGRVLGTTDYVSPEQALGHEVSGQSDLYSLGIVLYEMLTGSVPFRGENQVAVAMKHVREELPDVQMLRPEVSASLAAVIDRATAKDLHERYRSDEELIADLEDVLALEAARSGSATGEATTVLRTLPRRARRRVPLRVRSRPVWIAIAALLIVAALVGGIVLLGDRTHRGTGTERTAGGGGAATQVGLNSDAAHDYDPLGDDTEHADQNSFAIDGNPATVWTTESYTTGDLQKAGVGLALDATPGAVFRELRVRTPTPGFSADVYVASDNALPATLPDAGWKLVATVPSVDSKQKIDLDTAGQSARWVLLWITRLPPDGDKVEISELSLYR